MKTFLRLLIPALLALALAPTVAAAAPGQESMFQDDPLLVYGSPTRMEKTLDRLKTLGVDRVRVSVFWALVAPANDQEQRPANFAAADPAAYPAANWERYDRIMRAAQARGIGVNLNLTSPIPRWAAALSPRPDLQTTFGPSADEFGQFVRAVGTRYSGTYGGLPRADYWSIWNEPNQAGWLTPQWNADPRDAKRFVEVAPHAYRALVGAAYSALVDTGHAKDTILIGETAPKGKQTRQGLSESLDVLHFLRSMYCLDENLQFFKGTSADVRGCPQDNPKAFVEQNPGLFHATGYAHHPYELLLEPTRKSGWADWVTIANLNDLTRELRRIYARYGQALPTKRGVPLYLTEYGYQTPPDPISVPFSRQATYLNQSEFIAYRNPLVRATSQFLLVDDAPVPGVDPKKNPRDAYLTFQSGLRTLGGKNKPAYRAYITPVEVRPTTVRRDSPVRVSGLLRPLQGKAQKSVRIQWRKRGSKSWRTLATRRTSGAGHHFSTRLRVPSSGSLRLRWVDGRRPAVSRTVAVGVRR